ncbi:MAG: diguanylate cyclase [Desulfobacca sp.]|nr:diguanylate cyclase [Desulfobacca sp.]
MAVHILLADDDLQIISALEEYLQAVGYQVRTVTDGNQALAQFQAEKFQIAILDLFMPGRSGLELLSEFKKISPETEVIIFTGYADLDSAIEALRRGAYDYLLKPVPRLESLHALIERALERQRLSQANQAMVAELTAAREALAQQRRLELKRIRQIGEGLSKALNLDRIIELLLDLMWDTLSLSVVGLKLRAGDNLPDKFACRVQDGWDTKIQPYLETWMQQALQATSLETPPVMNDSSSAKLAEQPIIFRSGNLDRTIPALIWAPLWVNHKLVGMLGSGRESAFTPEEQEIFEIFVLQTVTALKNLALFEQVKNLASKDSLTGLFNQRYFWQALSKEVKRCRRYGCPLALLFLDLDNFKTINDRYGHTVGDKILQELSARLQDFVRSTDLICRYGGEEFIIMLIQTSKDQAAILAERLRQKITAAPMKINDLEIPLTVSIGVAGLTDQMEPEELVHRADSAMYCAKQSGRNQVMVD